MRRGFTGERKEGETMGKHVKTLWALYIALGLSASSATAYTHEEVFQKTVPAAGISKLSVRNFNGEISVQPWDKPEIQIEAKKRVNHSSQEKAEEYARKIEIAVETNGNAVEVRTIMPGQKDDWDWVEGFFSLDWLFEGHLRGTSVSYAISAPRRMDTELASTNGGVQIGAMEGRAELRTTNGAVKAEGVKGELRGRTTNGAIVLSGLTGGCDAGTTNGKISAEFLSLGSQGCELHTTNGGIRITLPENARADLEASTTNGSVTSELPLSLQGEVNKRRMEGKINGGGPPLKLHTTNGNIAIEKAEITGASTPSASASPAPSGDRGAVGKFLSVRVWDEGQEKVKINLPLTTAQEILQSLPDEAKELMDEKGVNFKKILLSIMKNPKPGKLVEIQDADSRVEISVE